jgi:hypothetical protein
MHRTRGIDAGILIQQWEAIGLTSVSTVYHVLPIAVAKRADVSKVIYLESQPSVACVGLGSIDHTVLRAEVINGVVRSRDWRFAKPTLLINLAYSPQMGFVSHRQKKPMSHLLGLQ